MGQQGQVGPRWVVGAVRSENVLEWLCVGHFPRVVQISATGALQNDWAPGEGGGPVGGPVSPARPVLALSNLAPGVASLLFHGKVA